MPIDLEQLEDSPHFLDLLVQMEDVLDSLDIYVYRNWFYGDVVDGPVVRRHWISMTLNYPEHRMPDPRAIRRLARYGIRVDFKKVERERDEAKDAEEAAEAETRGSERKVVDDKPTHEWMVSLEFPRRLLTQMNAAELDFYDEEIDADDVQAAQDSGLDDQSGLTTDEKVAQDQQEQEQSAEAFR